MSYFDDASLVMIPSGYKDQKVYSVKPIDGTGDLTFSRGSDIEATRVASNGYIEKAKVNLLLQSNTFSTTWTNSNSTESSGYAGYDGTNDAWKLEEDSNTGTHLIQQNVVSGAGVHTISCYFKSAERSGVQFLLEGSASYAFANFNLSTGAVHSSGQSGSFTLIDAQITSVGGGWYRASVAAATSVATSWVKIYTLDAGFNTSYAGTTGEGIYIQDAQLNYGLVAQEYQETTTTSVVTGITNDLPRLDYSGGASCPSLLLEPERTNILNQSELFTDWTRFSSAAVITTNTAISPEGFQNASTFTFSGSGADYAFKDAAITTSGASVYSIYLKVASGTRNVVLATGLASNTKVVEVTTEWQRFELNIPSALTNDTIGIDNRASSGGTGTAGAVLAYGAQLEAGSYPTSYIPTYGTSATRTADDAYKTGVSSLIGQTEGTIYAEFFMPNDYTGIETHRISLSDGSLDNWVFMSIPEVGDETRMYYRIGASTKVDTQTTNSPFTHNQVNKIAYAYKSGDLRIYINGVSVLSSSLTYGAFTQPLSRINITGGSGGSSPQNMANNINQVLVFKTRLSNSDLAALTS